MSDGTVRYSQLNGYLYETTEYNLKLNIENVHKDIFCDRVSKRQQCEKHLRARMQNRYEACAKLQVSAYGQVQVLVGSRKLLWKNLIQPSNFFI